MEFNITHTLEELNLILEALSNKPFKEVANLISKLHKLAHEQATAQQATQQSSAQPDQLPQ